MNLRHVWQIVVLAGSLGAAAVAQADSVVVLTSFPREVTDVYKQAFEKKHPKTTMEVINKSASGMVAHLQGLAPGQRPDVVWASDPGAFGALAQAGLLHAAPQVRNTGIPSTIGPLPMNGPQDLYFGQALSGYGLMSNTQYLRERGLIIPREWADVAQPAYFGHVLMSSPSRSGTTHLTVEAILQAEGWEKGWALMLQIAGNSAAITERSFDVPAGINKGQAGVGLVVDFFGLAGRAAGHPVSFSYPSNTVVLPASIAVVAGARTRPAAERFVHFALSNEGQELMYEPQVSRMPASPFAAASMKVPSSFPNVYAVARKSPLAFSMQTYEQRRVLVSLLFDRTITAAHAELRAAVQALHQAERALRGTGDAESLALLHQARARLTAPVVSAPQSADAGLLAMSPRKEGTPETELERRWSEQAKANYTAAMQLATKALRAKGTRGVAAQIRKESLVGANPSAAATDGPDQKV
jgi:phosphoglycerate transport regulatory protein PgtC